MTHTPGPWKGHGKWPTNIKDEDGEMIATVWNIGEDVAPHNALLIAAAPDMLAALEAFDDVMTEFGERGVYSPSPINEAWRIAIEALAAAKGGE